MHAPFDLTMEEEGEIVAGEDGDGGLSNLFERNKVWAERKTRSDPSFFRRLVGQQTPRYFWIGCSDSRVPATEIVDLDPGEMFVHRNVANLASASDLSFSAALQFAVDVLQVRHVIVVGHYGCGGISTAISGRANGKIGFWLNPVRKLYCSLSHSSSNDVLDPNILCELNVVAQVEALVLNPTIGAAWARQADLTSHGWVYGIGDGLLRSVCDPVTPLGRSEAVNSPKAQTNDSALF